MRTELIFSKKCQLQKNKPKNDKKLPSKELQQYQFWLKENHPQCQDANIKPLKLITFYLSG